MRYLFLIVPFLMFSCSSNDPIMEEMEPEENPIEETEPSCDELEEYIYFNTPSFTDTLHSCWINAFFEHTPIIHGDLLGWFNWDYDNNPGIQNTIIFQHPNTAMQLDTAYRVTSVYGATFYAGANDFGELYCYEATCSEFTIQFNYVDLDNKFCCGSFEGKVFDETDQLVDISGTFRARINT